jgi:hypothetical protein
MGAAVAVAVGAGSVGLATASGPDHPAVVVSITPCRLFDTRPGAGHVGPRTAPLGAADTISFVALGSVGDCVVPDDAVGLVMNVTVADPTADSFLTVYPGDGARPVASSLNWTAGQAPTPNQVTSRLGADGSIAFFNLAGTVDVVLDVVGYLSDSDSRYAPATQTLVVDAYAGATTGAVTTDPFGCLQLDPAANSSVRLPLPFPPAPSSPRCRSATSIARRTAVSRSCCTRSTSPSGAQAPRRSVATSSRRRTAWDRWIPHAPPPDADQRAPQRVSPGIGRNAHERARLLRCRSDVHPHLSTLGRQPTSAMRSTMKFVLPPPPAKTVRLPSNSVVIARLASV